MKNDAAVERLNEMALALLDVQRQRGESAAAYAALDKWPSFDAIIEDAQDAARRRPGRTTRRVVALISAVAAIIEKARAIRVDWD